VRGVTSIGALDVYTSYWRIEWRLSDEDDWSDGSAYIRLRQQRRIKDPERAGIKSLASETFRDRSIEFDPSWKRKYLIPRTLRSIGPNGRHGKSSCSM
jgi:hypothetical protein